MSESGTPADKDYHDEVGVVEGENGDVFVRSDDEQTLLLSNREALKLAGQLIRVADGGFEESHDDGSVKFADMELLLYVLPDGVTSDPAELDKYEWIDPGAWCWYSNDTDDVLEFNLGPRDGFEIGEVKD